MAPARRAGMRAAAAALAAAAAAPSRSLARPVTSLPGWDGELPSRHDAGYVTVDDANGTQYFYWYVEAEEVDPQVAPLVVWYHGGPGGSGLEGMWKENGPFALDAANRPVVNPLALSRRHNVLWLEQPCGVGFSRSNSSAAYSMNDDDAARLNYVFLKRWLAAFPALKGRDLWLTGASYAGMYIPTLVEKIFAGGELRSELRGVLIGNPHIWCDSAPKEKASGHWLFVQSWFYRGLVPYALFADYNDTGCNNPTGSASAACVSLYDQIKSAASVGLLSYKAVHAVDKDNINTDPCAGNGTISSGIEHAADHSLCPSAGSSTTRKGSIFGFKAYLRDPAVKAAVHADASPDWGKDSRFHYHGSDKSLIPRWRNILAAASGDANPLKVLIYSGDADIGNVPHQFTQTCLHELRDVRGNQTRAWGSWRVNGWHAGFAEAFAAPGAAPGASVGYTFATVKNAGHSVPMYQPLAAGALYDRFIATGTVDAH